MKLFGKKGFFLTIGLIQFFISVLLFYSKDNNLLLINLFVYWVCSVLFAIQKKQNAIIYFFFLITFFVFLLGQDVVLKIFNYIVSIDFVTEFPKQITSHIYFSMHTSLFFISLGVIWKMPSINNITFSISDFKRSLLQKTLLKIFYGTIIFKYIVGCILAYNTLKFGYAVIDADRVQVGYILTKAVQIADISFIAFLMLAPLKKDLLKPMTLFLGACVLSLIGGARGELMYSVVFIFAYLLFRDYLNRKNNQLSQIFISKKMMITILILTPFLLIFLGAYASIRHGDSVSSNGFMNDLLGFFVQQGGSNSLIGYVEVLKNQLPDTNISYTFGPILERVEPFRLNYLQPDRLTYDAYYGNNLGSTITCLVNPIYYFSGGGFGTQYIAELYADFGYTGIVLFSFLLGLIISKAVFFNSKNWIVATLFATAILHILQMPRSFYLTFLSALFSVVNILYLFFINRYVNNKLKRMIR